MTTTPEGSTPAEKEPDATSESTKAPGAEIGMSPGEGSTFEPEEDEGVGD